MVLRGLEFLCLLAFVALSATTPALAREPWRSAYDSISEYSDEPYRRGRVYRVLLEDLRPTQFAVGMGEVRLRREKIADKDKHELRAYLKKKVGAVVIGPGETFWLVDGHHLARTLTLEGHDEMLVRLVDDWSGLSQAEFFRRMIAAKRMWLHDGRGRGPHDPATLPKSLRGLGDDPYRTLAYRVRKEGGFRKTTVPYAEFQWAQFFRGRIPASLLRTPAKALERGLELAGSKEAAGLPGYRRCARLLSE